MEFNNNVNNNFNECQADLPISADWWFDLLQTSACGSSFATVTNHDNIIVDSVSTKSSFDSPSSSSSYTGSPISYTNLTRSDTLPFSYNAAAQRQPQHTSQSYYDPSTQIKVERRRNQNRVAQRAYRDRKEQRLRELEDELAQCKREYETLLHTFRSQQDAKHTLRAQTTKLSACITCLERETNKETAKKGETPPPQVEGT